MASMVTDSGHTWSDFFIFAASGTDDFAYSSFKYQIAAMAAVEDGTFRYADNERDGNLYFLEQEGGTHSGEYAMEYFYNGLCCTFACKAYQIGPKKRVGIFLTCTGSEPEEMKRHVRNILTLPSISRTISEYRTEVFTQCVSDSTCHDRADYLDRAKEIARWASEA